MKEGTVFTNEMKAESVLTIYKWELQADVSVGLENTVSLLSAMGSAEKD